MANVRAIARVSSIAASLDALAPPGTWASIAEARATATGERDLSDRRTRNSQEIGADSLLDEAL
jgi:hypothetical protein